MKNCIIFPGNLGPYEYTIDSAMTNLILPNDADVFILTSRNNYIHTLSPLTCTGGNNVATIITTSAEEFIRSKLGSKLKLLKFIEDIPEYETEMQRHIINVTERMSFIIESAKLHGKRVTWLNDNKRIYLDQNLRAKFLIKFITEYELSHNIKYDYILRSRIDLFYDSRIIINNPRCLDDLFVWMNIDCVYYGSANLIKKMCTEYMDKIGGFDCGASVITPQIDYRLGPEPQFGAFVKHNKLSNIYQLYTGLGFMYCLDGRRLIIKQYSEKMKELAKAGISPKDYYLQNMTDLFNITAFNKITDIIVIYYLHGGKDWWA